MTLLAKREQGKLVVINYRWKCQKGKRLTVTVYFQKRNLGTALSVKFRAKFEVLLQKQYSRCY